jgi:thiamine-phosphate pyrophosphorylase
VTCLEAFDRGLETRIQWGYAAGLVAVVTDRSLVAPGRRLVDVVRTALAGGADAVLVRERDLPRPERTDLVAELRRVCDRHGGVLLAHHLRRDEPVPSRGSWPSSPVGRSCHDLGELLRACDEGLDYVTLSPVAPTRSKPGHGPALGAHGLRGLVDAVRAARAQVPRIHALGGVDATNAGDWTSSGADGVAVMGAVMAADDPAAVVRSIVAAVRGAD